MRAPAPHPSAWRAGVAHGTWSARAGVGTHAAARPAPRAFPEFLREEQGAGGGAARRSLQEPSREGGAGGCSPGPAAPPPYKASYCDKPRCPDAWGKGESRENKVLNLPGVSSPVPLETWQEQASAPGSALLHPTSPFSSPGSPPATRGHRQLGPSRRWEAACVVGSLGSLASSLLLTKVIFSGLWLPHPGSGGLRNEGTSRLLQTRRLNPRGFPAGTGFSPTGSHGQAQQCC